MELHEQIFHDLIEFNTYVDARSKDNVIIKPVSVIPQYSYGGVRSGLLIFYTKETYAPVKDGRMKRYMRDRAGHRNT